MVAIFAIAPEAAWSLPFDFVSIVDNSGPFDTFRQPVLNNAGTAAFLAKLDSGVEGVFTGADPVSNLIADDSGSYTFAASSALSVLAINDSGTVAFFALRPGNASGIFTGPNPATDTVADRLGAYSFFSSPAINNAGVVAFSAGLDAGGEGLFRGSNPTTDTIVDSSGPYDDLPGIPAINDVGGVAFYGTLDDATPTNPFNNPKGIFTGPNPATDTVADQAGPYSNFVSVLALNNSGTVAFLAALDDATPETAVDNPIGIFIGPDPATDTIVDSNGPFATFGSLGINDAGTVAFIANLDDTRYGIFIGPDPVADKVVVTGDPLFGSTVEAVGFNAALNDNGDVAFNYRLADGREGIALARAPSADLAGDYNDDGSVDAADYTLWRDTLGQTIANGTGADGDSDGTIDPGDYEQWKLNFGETADGGSVAIAGSLRSPAVPEPTTTMPAMLGVMAVLLGIRHGVVVW